MATNRKYHLQINRAENAAHELGTDEHVRKIAEIYKRIGLAGTEPENRGEKKIDAFERLSRLRENRINLVRVFDNSKIFLKR